MRAFSASAEKPPKTTLWMMPEPRARQQRDRQLRHHPHVDDGAVAGFEIAALEHVGEARYQAVQFLVGDHALIAGFAFPQDGDFILAMRGEMPVETVVGDVGLAAHEPLRERRVPFEHVGPFLEPEQLALGQFAPEFLGMHRAAR